MAVQYQNTEQVLSTLGKLTSMYDGDISNIGQLDGNSSILSEDDNITPHPPSPPRVKQDKFYTASHLPTVATYNLRSMVPKLESLTTDLLERKIDCGFCQEIWYKETDKKHNYEVEKLLELKGLKFISTSRKPNKLGVSHGGAGIIVNVERFSCEKIPIQIPQNLEIVWGLLRPKSPGPKFKTIFAHFILHLIRGEIQN